MECLIHIRRAVGWQQWGDWLSWLGIWRITLTLEAYCAKHIHVCIYRNKGNNTWLHYNSSSGLLLIHFRRAVGWQQWGGCLFWLGIWRITLTLEACCAKHMHVCIYSNKGNNTWLHYNSSSGLLLIHFRRAVGWQQWGDWLFWLGKAGQSPRQPKTLHSSPMESLHLGLYEEKEITTWVHAKISRGLLGWLFGAVGWVSAKWFFFGRYCSEIFWTAFFGLDGKIPTASFRISTEES